MATTTDSDTLDREPETVSIALSGADLAISSSNKPNRRFIVSSESIRQGSQRLYDQICRSVQPQTWPEPADLPSIICPVKHITLGVAMRLFHGVEVLWNEVEFSLLIQFAEAYECVETIKPFLYDLFAKVDPKEAHLGHLIYCAATLDDAYYFRMFTKAVVRWNPQDITELSVGLDPLRMTPQAVHCLQQQLHHAHQRLANLTRSLTNGETCECKLSVGVNIEAETLEQLLLQGIGAAVEYFVGAFQLRSDLTVELLPCYDHSDLDDDFNKSCIAAFMKEKRDEARSILEDCRGLCVFCHNRGNMNMGTCIGGCQSWYYTTPGI